MLSKLLPYKKFCIYPYFGPKAVIERGWRTPWYWLRYSHSRGTLPKSTCTYTIVSKNGLEYFQHCIFTCNFLLPSCHCFCKYFSNLTKVNDKELQLNSCKSSPCTGRCQVLIFLIRTIGVVICVLVEHVILIQTEGIRC